MLAAVPPCDVVPAFSLGCRFVFENALFSRPIKLPIVGVLGVLIFVRPIAAPLPSVAASPSVG